MFPILFRVIFVVVIVGTVVGACSGDAGSSADASSIDGGDVDATGGGSIDAAATTIDAAGTGCVPVFEDELLCDGIDDDCNGIIDDVDIGSDGFCDCYTIGIIGTPGVNPASDFDTWLNATGTGVSRIGMDLAHELTAAEIEPFDIVILDRLTHQYSDEEAAILRAYVQSGHGLITMAGYSSSANDRNYQNSLVRAVGVNMVDPLYIDPTEVWHTHPITMGTTGVQFRGGWPIVAIDGEPLGQTLLENDDDGVILAIAREYGDGRAFVYGDEWITFDSEWQTIPGVTTLWQNAIRWVGPTWTCFPVID